MRSDYILSAPNGDHVEKPETWWAKNHYKLTRLVVDKDGCFREAALAANNYPDKRYLDRG